MSTEFIPTKPACQSSLRVIAESGVGKLTAATGATLAAVKVATRGWESRES